MKMCKTAFLALLLGAPYLMSAHAAELDNGIAAVEAGNYDKALEILLPLAKAGDAVAENAMGILYFSGLGVQQDDEEAAKWFRRSAENGFAKGQLHLGWMYANGRGVQQDSAEAHRWTRRAAEQGLADAQFSLAMMFADGIGIERDTEEAVRWVRKSADQGHPIAQHNLGASYALGLGVPQNYSEALAWYRKSAEQGFADAQYRLGLMYEIGEGVETDAEEASKWYAMAAEQGHPEARAKIGQPVGEGVSSTDQAGARNRYDTTYEEALLAAEQGDETAQFMLGAMYFNGDVVEQDYSKATYWFRKSVDAPWGFLDDSKIALGIMYHNGLGVPRDYVRAWYLFEQAANIGNPADVYNFEQEPISILNDRPDLGLAVEWFQEAAETDHAGAQFCLAIAYFRGLAVDKDQPKTIFWLEKSASLGNARAQYYLASMYGDGEGVPNDVQKAAFWYEKAALQEFAAAQTMLASLYYSGRGVPEDEEKARYWLRKAIENGDTTAMEFWGWWGFGEFDPNRLAGSFEKGTYVAPNKLFRADYQLTGGSEQDPCCDETIGDSFDDQTRMGSVSLSNEYGALNGVMYGPAEVVQYEPGDDKARRLEKWFHAVVMETVKSNAPEATVVREESRNFHNLDVWIAVVDIPGGGVMWHYDSETGQQGRVDSVRGFVVLRRGENVFALMCETNVLSFFGESRRYDPDNWDGFVTELSAFYSTMKFKDP